MYFYLLFFKYFANFATQNSISECKVSKFTAKTPYLILKNI